MELQTEIWKLFLISMKNEKYFWNYDLRSKDLVSKSIEQEIILNILLILTHKTFDLIMWTKKQNKYDNQK